MDIRDRIIEAIVEKLISMRLEENQYSGSHIKDTGDPNAGKKSGTSNPRYKEPKGNNGKKNFQQPGFVPPKGTKKLSGEQAGASGGESMRTGRLSRGPDPEKAKNTRIPPVTPSKETQERLKGGKENKRGVES